MARDVEAHQLVLNQLNRAKGADTESRKLLEAARKANLQYATDRSSATAGRAVLLAQKAYEARVSSVIGTTRATYALLAAREGDATLTANETMKQVTDARQRDVLVLAAKASSLRRNILLQAGEQAEKAFNVAPPLPRMKVNAAAHQATVGMSEMYRPPSYVSRMSAFFPADVIAAAGSLRGNDAPLTARSNDLPLGNFAAVEAAIEDGAQKVQAQATVLAKQVTAQEAGASDLSVQAENLFAQLQARHTVESAGPAGIPWLHIAGAGLLGFLIHKALS